MTGDHLIYADPYSGQEILLLPGNVPSGAAYDPRRTDPPIAWLGGCAHCLGDARHLSIHVRRQIQLLSSCKSVSGGKLLGIGREYDVPCCDHKIRHFVQDDREQQAIILIPDAACVAASQLPGDKIVIHDKVRSKITLRCLRLIFSGRLATPGEILAVSRILAKEQEARNHRPGHRSACRKIDWIAVSKQAEQISVEQAS